MPETYIPTLEEVKSSKMAVDQFRVSGDGTFFTVQGEGQSIGKPAVFLRLNLCNLQCDWCDTRYTWDVNSPEFWQEGENWDYEKARSEITQYPIKRLVITGGEPMLQQGRITQFVDLIPEWDIEIETNGTIPPNEALAQRCQFNISPKLDNSGNNIKKRYKPDVLKKFSDLANSNFKFVVRDDSDLDEVASIVEDCDLNPSKIIIMPEGRTQEETKKHALEVIDKVKEKGWRLTPRLHVMLWGDERGI